MNGPLTIIFVCHYFPPEDNVGIRRVTFWSNYYSSQGYKVIVITTNKKNSEMLYDVVNKSVDVIEFSALTAGFVRNNLHSFSSSKVTKNKKINESLVRKILVQIKRKYVNPVFGQLIDNRLISVLLFSFKLKFGFYKNIVDYLPKRNAVVISTAPPWPTHLLGKCISEINKLPFFADYRDPFSNNHMFSSIFSSIEEKIDNLICSSASGVFTVSPSWQKYYEKMNSNTLLLRNGYDSDMFNLSEVCDNNSDPITIDCKNGIELSYFGSIDHPARVPHKLLNYLKYTNKKIIVNFYGSCSLIDEYIYLNPSVSSKIKLHGKLSYDDAIDKMKSSSLNLVSETMSDESLSHRGLIPTKIYEYLAALRPIVAIVNSNSDMAAMLKKSGLLVHDICSDIDLDLIFNEKRLASIELNPDVEYINSLSRQKVAEQLIVAIKEAIN